MIALGLLLAAFDLHTDFQQQKAQVERDIREIITVTTTPAERAVYLLDNTLAEEIVRGLVSYELLKSASLFDENDQLMASADKAILDSKLRWLTRHLVGLEKKTVVDIRNDDMQESGALVLIVDNHAAYVSYYTRSAKLLLKGILRTLCLALIMVMLYHFLLTRPMFQLTSHITEFQTQDNAQHQLPQIKGHEKDEIGFLIDTFNGLISKLEAQTLSQEQREKQLRIVLDSSPNLVFAVNSQLEFTLLNRSTAQFYGSDMKKLTGENFYELLKAINADEAEEIMQSIISAQSKLQEKLQVEQSLTNVRGARFVMHMTLKPFLLGGEDSVLIIASDITARVEAEARVENLAFFDSLTHLPNRNQVQEILFNDIHSSMEKNMLGALLFIDIDDFKRINDTLGHAVGDELLLQIANSMQSILDDDQRLARLGGDEFVLSLPELSEKTEATRDLAAGFAQRILNCIRSPIEMDGHLFSVGASIGIALYPEASTDTDKILQFADTAMYKAKAAGRNTYCFFESSMADEASRLLKLESEIQHAIENQEFTFHLQPFLDSQDHSLVGAEALIRWRHPQKGIIPPGAFIPFLERSPMIGRVGNMLLDQVCGFINACRHEARLPQDFRISVNIAANEIYQPDFVQLVTDTLDKHKVPGDYIEMEITEGVALTSFTEITQTMDELKELGISFALDDFGTGYSSLNYLKSLAVDRIKIDKSFIDDIPHNSQDASLVSSVIEIAKNLNLGVVVEGIERKEQADWLISRHQIYMQGYLFDKPLPPSEFVRKYLSQA